MVDFPVYPGAVRSRSGRARCYYYQDLGTLGGINTTAYGINNSGQVVGNSFDASGNVHAFLKSPGQPMQDLGTLGGSSELCLRPQRLRPGGGASVGCRPPYLGLTVKDPGQPLVNLGALEEATATPGPSITWARRWRCGGCHARLDGLLTESGRGPAKSGYPGGLFRPGLRYQRQQPGGGGGSRMPTNITAPS